MYELRNTWVCRQRTQDRVFLYEMQSLNRIQKSYWKLFVASLPEDLRPLSPSITASFAGSKEITDEPLGLYLSGKNSAGSSIKEDFLTVGDAPLEYILRPHLEYKL